MSYIKKLFLLIFPLICLEGYLWADATETSNTFNLNKFFGNIVEFMAEILFWPLPLIDVPLIVVTLVFGGIFFTFRYGFVHLRLFRHSIDVVRGKYDNPDDAGEIPHFHALTSALSATVGLGNIAGVAVAITTGGPGAVFWMWIAAFFGMSLKFSSCTFAQLYRRVDDKGRVLGGPMVYLDQGFVETKPKFFPSETKWAPLKHLFSFLNNSIIPLAKAFAIFYAVMTIIASIGGGNLFQANQTYELLSGQFPSLVGLEYIIGTLLAFLVGLVIIGGIKRIGEVTSRMVPAMCLFYVTVCLIIIFGHISEVPTLFVSIFEQAISPEAAFGGFMGVLIMGIKRASFSNEAGLGSAAIAHSAARTDEPVREGVVAMMGPFIDTHIVCTMSALAILITGSHLDPTLVGKGAQITAKAFASVSDIMPYFLTLAAIVFAFSTMISWSYYGERATEYLFGRKNLIVIAGYEINSLFIYRVIYVLFIIIAPALSLSNVVDFADLSLLSMAFPNILGMIVLSGIVSKMIKDYIKRLKTGEMKPYN